MPRLDRVPDEVVNDHEMYSTLWKFYEHGGWRQPPFTELACCHRLYKLGLLDKAVIEPQIARSRIMGHRLFRITETALPAVAEASINADDDVHSEARSS